MSHLSPLLKQATSVVAVRGEGVYLYDADGRRYLDFTAGIGVTSTGHRHPEVVAATQRQVATIVHAQTTTVMHPWLLELSDRLAGKLPPLIVTEPELEQGLETYAGALDRAAPR